MHDIVLSHNGIYHHRNIKKVGGSINQSNDTIRRMTSQVNNGSTGIAGLGTGNNILSKSSFKPSGTTITIGGGNLTSLSKLNFNTDKSKDRNIRLRL
jgi:hypothetical protein